MDVRWGAATFSDESGVPGNVQGFLTDLSIRVREKFMEEHANDVHFKNGKRGDENAFTPEEKAAVDYAKFMLSYGKTLNDTSELWAQLSEQVGEGEFSAIDVNLYDVGGRKGRGAFGLFLGDELFGLKNLGIPSNSPNPDLPAGEYRINQNIIFNALKGVEFKSRMANIEMGADMEPNLSITAGQITAQSEYYIPRQDLKAYEESEEFKSFKKYFKDENIRRKIAVYEMIRKMQNLLYFRISTSEFLPGQVNKKGNRRRVKIMAFILFMRLLIDKLIDEVDNIVMNKRADFRIAVEADVKVKKGWNRETAPEGKMLALSTVTYTVKLESTAEFKPSSTAGEILGKLTKELNYLRGLYEQEYDFINQIEEKKLNARTFYGTIKNLDLDVRAFEFHGGE